MKIRIQDMEFRWYGLLLACLLSVARGQAQEEVLFTQYSTQNGLTSNAVRSIAQDRLGFIWLATASGLNRFDGLQFRQYKSYQDDSCSISDNFVYCLLIDRQGTLWAGTRGGLNRYDSEKDCFQYVMPDTNTIQFPFGADIFFLLEAPDGSIWMGMKDRLLQYDPAGNRFKCFPLPSGALLQNSDQGCVGSLALLPDGLLLSSFLNGLWHFSPDTGVFTSVPTPLMPGRENRPLTHHLYKDPDGQVWAVETVALYRYIAATKQIELEMSVRGEQYSAMFRDRAGNTLVGIHGQGIARYDRNFRKLSVHRPNPDQGSQDANHVNHIFQDNQGAVWLGLAWGGAFKFDTRPNPFHAYQRYVGRQANGFPKDLGGACERSNGQIWTGSMAEGCHIFDPSTNRFTHLKDLKKYPAPMCGKFVIRVFEDSKQRIWLGSWTNGLMVYHDKTGDFYHFPNSSNDTSTNLGLAISAIGELPDGRIWAGSLAGMTFYTENPQAQKLSQKFKAEFFTNLGGMSMSYVNCATTDHQGNLWIGGNGLLYRDAQSGKYIVFQNEPRNTSTLSSSRVTSLFEDSRHRLWVGTSGGGLNLWRPSENRFIKFRQRDGLISDNISDIAEDQHGQLWLFCGRGVCKFDPEKFSWINYDKSDGLPCERFALNSAGKSRLSGNFFAGAQDGFVWFHPDSISTNDYQPPVVIASLKKYVLMGSRIEAVEVRGISVAKSIDLPYNENTLSFDFAALNYRQPFKNQYAYRLEGLADQWVILGANRSVTFSALPPGMYVLHVKASNNEGVWNETGTRLEILIRPPWWRTGWAYCLYAAVALGLLFLFFRLQVNRNLARAEARRFKELNEDKSRFLNTVSHELRTPLTSIMGFSKIIKKRMEERLLSKLDLSDPRTQKAADQIMANLEIVTLESERLTAMVNDVLDLSKIESGKIEWQEKPVQLDQILERAMIATENLFEQKNLLLHSQIAAPIPEITGDPDRLLQVMVNLLSNAVKFTENGSVTCRLNLQDDHHLLVVVSDTGIGVPRQFQEQVFEAFRQIGSDSLIDKPKGTGLGLSICREIVEHHGGRIWMDSEPGVGSNFYFTLPIQPKRQV
jgi:two-component system, sensor histidine kinase ChiS